MKLIPTIGIEMHCGMKSHTKVFSPALNTYTKHSNNHVSEIDIALPGILPTLNKECIRKSIMMATILHCKLPEYIYFDRKNYYYPDLPKGYQITQSHEPIGTNGYIDVPYNGDILRVDIHDIHLEEDTAKIEHLDTESLINYNRAGVPLLELVTDPVFHSKEEVIAFLEYIRMIYQYTDISDADIRKGQIRCDVNISVGEENGPFGTRVEIKGVDSFSNIQKVIDIEVQRQMELIESGKKDEIIQETRRFDEANNKTTRMRGKVDAIDYKYFVEPNIPKIRLDKKWVNEITSNIVELPLSRMKRYKELGLKDEVIRIITKEKGISDNFDEVLKDKSLADFYEESLSLGGDPKQVSNWLTGNILGYLNKFDLTINDIYLTPKMLVSIINMIEIGSISSKQSKEVLVKVIEEEKEPEVIVKESGLSQITDEKELLSIVNEIIEENPTQVVSYKSQPRLLDYFIGQMMKKTKGKANPSLASKLLKQELDKK